MIDMGNVRKCDLETLSCSIVYIDKGHLPAYYLLLLRWWATRSGISGWVSWTIKEFHSSRTLYLQGTRGFSFPLFSLSPKQGKCGPNFLSIFHPKSIFVSPGQVGKIMVAPPSLPSSFLLLTCDYWYQTRYRRTPWQENPLPNGLPWKTFSSSECSPSVPSRSQSSCHSLNGICLQCSV